MPPADEDERYIKSLISAVSDLSTQLGKVEERINERVTMLLSNYREDVYRTTMGIHLRLVSYEEGLRLDRKAREARQVQLDAQLAAIEHNQRLWIRVVIIIALVAVGVGIGIWIW